jgi:hypothetical protein
MECNPLNRFRDRPAPCAWPGLKLQVLGKSAGTELTGGNLVHKFLKWSFKISPVSIFASLADFVLQRTILHLRDAVAAITW